MSATATPAQVATIIRAVVCAAQPISARRIELLTGYSPRMVMGVLTDLQAAGDVTLSACGPRHSRWRMSQRWREAMRRDIDLDRTARAAGMRSALNMGSGSCVWSEGCQGVTQEHLERFVSLVQASS